ncbi:MAG: VirB4 family type IV secretion system protein [Clostridia bacterium]|nr:VirB4 family type IV secretion system protein [Clostridia bacterium]
MRLKTLQNVLKVDKEKYTVPRCVRDTIPVSCIYEDGIFKTGNRFSKTFRFQDINYQVAGKEDKEKMFMLYCELLNSFDNGATTKLTIWNRQMTEDDFTASIFMEYKEDGLDDYRREYNEMLSQKAHSANGIFEEKLVTVSVPKKTVAEARLFFVRVWTELEARFSALGSRLQPLSTKERLKALHDFYRGEKEPFSYDFCEFVKKGEDLRDFVAPESLEKHRDYLQVGDKFVRTFYLKEYASFMKDSFLSELSEVSKTMILSLDVVPVPTEEAVKEVEKRLLGVETNITNWQRRQNQHQNYSAVLPYDMELQRKESKEFLEDLTTRDQKMLLTVFTICLKADSLKQLEQDTESLKTVVQKQMCQVCPLTFQQLAGLQTVLPFGCRKIDTFRTLTTESLGVLMPFKVQEIMEEGGIYFGENAISHNLILCNKENLLNQSCFLLGVPGSGKSFSAKELITFLILNTEDEIVICDPEGEYARLVQAMGDIGQVIQIAAGGRDRINAMEMVDGYGENNPIVVKSEFILSLIEQMDKEGVGPQHKSIIDRCVGEVYGASLLTGKTPTLCDLRECILHQPEKEAQQIALALELYTEGSLDIFGKESNVDVNKRVVVFDIHGLGAQLKPTGLLVITDAMVNRVTMNAKKGKKTHLFLDEFHVVFENAFSAQFFSSAWRQFRKRNAYPTAITQNVEYLLDSVQASTMLSNSEFIIMLNQAASDREKLGNLLNISKEQMGYITGREPGCGLMKVGGSLVPFVNHFPKDTKLYKLMTTKPGEVLYGRT